MGEVVITVLGGILLYGVLLAVGAAIVTFLLVLVGFGVIGLSQLLGTPLSHIPVDLNRDLTWDEMVPLVGYGLAAVLVAAPVGFGLHALVERMAPLAGRRVVVRLLGVPALLAASALSLWAAVKGSSDAAFGGGLVLAYSAYRLARGLPAFGDDTDDRE